MASPTEPGRTIINAKSQVRIFDSTASVFTNGAPVNGLASSATLAWVRMASSTSASRAAAISGASGTLLRLISPPRETQLSASVPHSAASTLLSLAWVGHDLWATTSRLPESHSERRSVQLHSARLPGNAGVRQTANPARYWSLTSFSPTIPMDAGSTGATATASFAMTRSAPITMQVWNQSGRVCAGPLEVQRTR